MGERRAPSPLQKEKRGSAKFDISKVSFPDIGKFTNSWNLGIADSEKFVRMLRLLRMLC